MACIGITGGVGAGKSEVLSYLSGREDCCVLRADDLAKELMEPGGSCHSELVRAFSQDGVFDSKGRIIIEAMSRRIFSDEKKRLQANAIIHPAVKQEILCRVEAVRQEGRFRFFFLEAALLLEEGYDAICDEIWYIYASEDERRGR
ncbi:MAG: dephospho-CoA kinase, partial [Lachnospiraceae bacterium]|nr:dephospho-CoA kinase [Lachnospiraceae bacterium]